MKKLVLFFLIINLMPSVSARSGCCSHHGGVAGCSSSGRQICNDGTYSPSCTCTPAYVYGCTDSNAKNYNSSANKDNGSCIYYKYGCMDKNAVNYDDEADKDDGECKYEVKKTESLSSNSEEDMSNDDTAGSVTAIGSLGIIGYIIYKKRKKNN